MKENRNAYIPMSISMTRQEKEKVMQEAYKHDMSVSKFIREAILYYTEMGDLEWKKI